MLIWKLGKNISFGNFGVYDMDPPPKESFNEKATFELDKKKNPEQESYKKKSLVRALSRLRMLLLQRLLSMSPIRWCKIETVIEKGVLTKRKVISQSTGTFLGIRISWWQEVFKTWLYRTTKTVLFF